MNGKRRARTIVMFRYLTTVIASRQSSLLNKNIERFRDAPFSTGLGLGGASLGFPFPRRAQYEDSQELLRKARESRRLWLMAFDTTRAFGECSGILGMSDFRHTEKEAVKHHPRSYSPKAFRYANINDLLFSKYSYILPYSFAFIRSYETDASQLLLVLYLELEF